MSKKVNKADDLDELSLLLDEMNAGRKPECEDRELAELLAVAEMIKNTSGPICPPQHILDQTVDRALAGLEAGKPKPLRSWLFSGALGTAAAVILVIGLNMLPSWQDSVPVVPPVIVTQQKESPQAKADSDQQPTIPSAASADTAPSTKQPAAAVEHQKTNTTVAQVTPAAPPRPPVTTREKAVMTEEAPRTSQAKSAYIPEAAKSPAPAMTPLKLPGKVPDLVVTDWENGTLRQVFYKGTPQEVTVTQRLQSREEGNTQAKSQIPSVSKAADRNQNLINTIRVTVAGQEVTIEGRLPQQELLKLAESLSP